MIERTECATARATARECNAFVMGIDPFTSESDFEDKSQDRVFVLFSKFENTFGVEIEQRLTFVVLTGVMC